MYNVNAIGNIDEQLIQIMCLLIYRGPYIKLKDFFLILVGWQPCHAHPTEDQQLIFFVQEKECVGCAYLNETGY